jgi:hypothetical protein
MITRLLITVMLIGFLLANISCSPKPSDEQHLKTAMSDILPEEFRQELDRFTFINRSTGVTLKEFTVLGNAQGTYLQ